MLDYSLIPAVLLAVGCYFSWRSRQQATRLVTALFAVALLVLSHRAPYPVARDLMGQVPDAPDSLFRHQPLERAWFSTGVHVMQRTLTEVESDTRPERALAIGALFFLAVFPPRRAPSGPADAGRFGPDAATRRTMPISGR